MTPRHDPVRRPGWSGGPGHEEHQRFGSLDWVNCAMVVLAIYSLIGAIAGCALGDAHIALCFGASLAGCGFVLVASAIFKGRPE